MGRFDELAGLTESHSQGDVAPLIKALLRVERNLSADNLKHAKQHLGVAKGLAMKLARTAESDSRFDQLAGLTEDGGAPSSEGDPLVENVADATLDEIEKLLDEARS